MLSPRVLPLHDFFLATPNPIIVLMHARGTAQRYDSSLLEQQASTVSFPKRGNHVQPVGVEPTSVVALEFKKAIWLSASACWLQSALEMHGTKARCHKRMWSVRAKQKREKLGT